MEMWKWRFGREESMENDEEAERFGEKMVKEMREK